SETARFLGMGYAARTILVPDLQNWQAILELVQRGMSAVAVRQKRGGDRPGDPDHGVVPGDPDLARPIVQRRALVFDLGDRAEDAEAVREAGRHVDLAEVLGRERHRYPPREAWRSAADVHGNVEHLAFD